MTEICVNKVISDLDTGAEYLVLWTSPGNTYGYWYELTGSARTPRQFILAELNEIESIGRYELSDFIPEQPRDENTLTDAERKSRDRIWNIMQSVVEYEPDIYDAKTRGIMLKIITEEHGIAKSNLYGYLDRYWRSGKTKNAFLPKYYNRGGKGVVRQSGNKIGRKAAGAAPGKALTAKDHANFAAAIKKYYLNRNKLTLKDVYEKLLADSYSKPRLDKSGQIELLPASELPSLRQFRYWYTTKRNAVTEQKKARWRESL